jgi:ATP-binding protein involved in chromosome partitioning
VLVTTPQTVSVADTRRAVRMYQKLNVPDARADREHEPFRLPDVSDRNLTSSARAAARRWPRTCQCRFSAVSRSTSRFRVGGDTGVPIVVGEPDSPAAKAFRAAAERLAAQLSIAAYTKKPIPLHAGIAGEISFPVQPERH